MSDFKTPADIVAESGGIDGYMRESELRSEFEREIGRAEEFISQLSEDLCFSVDDYNRWKSIGRGLRKAVFVLARRVRELESR